MCLRSTVCLHEGRGYLVPQIFFGHLEYIYSVYSNSITAVIYQYAVALKIIWHLRHLSVIGLDTK